MAGSAAQHAAQQDAVRARHGNSPPQATHEACRTIRAVSRPIDESVCNTEWIVWESVAIRYFSDPRLPTADFDIVRLV